ncbi:Uncharacterised protein [uncultured archaeon]|nr:Uncharacterised protein [uncultured archaeon]
MKNKSSILVLLVLLGFLFQISNCSAENITQNFTNPNPIMTFLEQTTDSPLLKIIGINETASFKEIALTIILVLISIAILYGFADFTEMIPGKLVSLLIAVIIVLAGSYKGFTFNIAKQIIEAPNNLWELVKNPIFWIVAGIIILILVFSPWIKKIIKKEKESAQDEKIEKKRRKAELLENIKDYETNVELKRYGANPDDV